MKKILIVVLAISVISCKKTIGRNSDADFYFTQTQPINDSEIIEFPNRYIGKYKTDDSSFLNITKNYIISESYFRFKVGKNSLDTIKNEFTFKSGKLVSKVAKEEYDVIEVGDSLELSSVEMDTLFIFSDKQKAKRINGSVVLSTKDSIYWKTEWLTLKNDELTVNQPFDNDDNDRIDSLLKVKPEILAPRRYLIRPSRSEFWKIMKLKNFGSEQKFKKIKPNK